jgi:hypothetical protein
MTGRVARVLIGGASGGSFPGKMKAPAVHPAPVARLLACGPEAGLHLASGLALQLSGQAVDNSVNVNGG